MLGSETPPKAGILRKFNNLIGDNRDARSIDARRDWGSQKWIYLRKMADKLSLTQISTNRTGWTMRSCRNNAESENGRRSRDHVTRVQGLFETPGRLETRFSASCNLMTC